jgi:hypothetical protein
VRIQGVLGLLLIAIVAFAFWFGLSHPTATSPLPPIVMQSLVGGAFSCGIAIVIKVVRLIKR